MPENTNTDADTDGSRLALGYLDVEEYKRYLMDQIAKSNRERATAAKRAEMACQESDEARALGEAYRDALDKLNKMTRVSS